MASVAPIAPINTAPVPQTAFTVGQAMPPMSTGAPTIPSAGTGPVPLMATGIPMMQPGMPMVQSMIGMAPMVAGVPPMDASAGTASPVSGRSVERDNCLTEFYSRVGLHM